MSKRRRVVPYLTVHGAVEAIKFYEEAFDAEELVRMMAKDGERVMHAELEINDGTIMLADEFSEINEGEASVPSVAAAKPAVAIHLDFKKPKHVDQTMDRAQKAGATIIMPAQDMFWGARYGRVRDPFGHVWAFNAPLKKIDLENNHDRVGE